MSAAEVISALARVLRSHGGGLVLEQDGPDVRVRFTGMCAACPCRVLCHDNLVRPALLAVEGVETVDAPGTRVDISVRRRIAALYGRQEAPDVHNGDAGPGPGRGPAD